MTSVAEPRVFRKSWCITYCIFCAPFLLMNLKDSSHTKVKLSAYCDIIQDFHATSTNNLYPAIGWYEDNRNILKLTNESRRKLIKKIRQDHPDILVL